MKLFHVERKQYGMKFHRQNIGTQRDVTVSKRAHIFSRNLTHIFLAIWFIVFLFLFPSAIVSFPSIMYFTNHALFHTFPRSK